MCLRLAGEADLSVCGSLAEALAVPVAAGGDVHLDLAALTFADVSVTRMLAQTAAGLGPDRKMVLHGASPGLQRLVQLCWPDQPGLEVTDG
jgi:anti-anti-sigma regulatory factor